MKIVRVQDIIGTEREVSGPGWTSRRMLLKKDGMGFSFHETIIPAGAVLNLWYKHHLEAVYCVGGNGTITDKATGEGWRKRGAAFFQGKSRDTASGPRQQPEGTLPLDGGAASA